MKDRSHGESNVWSTAQTDRFMVRAMCGVQLKDNKRAKHFMFMMGLKEIIDQLATASCVRWDSHELRREDGHVLGREDGHAFGREDGHVLRREDGHVLRREDGHVLRREDGHVLRREDGHVLRRDDGHVLRKALV